MPVSGVNQFHPPWAAPYIPPWWVLLANQGFGAGAARSQGIWLEPEPSLRPGSGSTLNFCLIIHANYMELNLI